MLQFARKVSASAAFVTAWARRFPFLGVQVNPFSAIAPVPVSFLNAASTLAFSQFEGGGLHFTRFDLHHCRLSMCPSILHGPPSYALLASS
ncbi:uncharacterized protein [Arachis hypogaea]|uniref:uncharacterized protein isoform X3 n=1 Tax=Arachis hypogaea TaxID=3818 RepID=UPI003B217EAE